MAVNEIIECFRRDLVPEYCYSLESSVVYTAPPFFVESLNGHSNRILRCVRLHIHAEQIIPTVFMSNIHIS